VLYGIFSAVIYGLSDIVAKRVSDRAHPLILLFSLQLVGALFLCAAYAVLGQSLPQPNVDYLNVLFVVFAVVFLLLGGTYFLYASISAGPLYVVVPIASNFAAITATIGVVYERNGSVFIGLGCLVVFTASFLLWRTLVTPDDEIFSQGVKTNVKAGVFAVLAACFHGVAFFLYQLLASALEPVSVMLLVRVLGLAIISPVMALSILSRAVSFRRMSGSDWLLLLSLGFLDTLAALVFNFGVKAAAVSLVAVGLSVHPLIPLLYSLMNRERRITWWIVGLTLAQVIGLAVVRMS
jgi:drug/metabolite transporter (DMT)-like permease